MTPRQALYAFACLLPLLLVLGVGTWALQQQYHPRTGVCHVK